MDFHYIQQVNSTRIAIIGGGLAGLTAALHLSRKGYSISLFEKNSYPNHKVCGEYLSNEILPYLSEIGVNLIQTNAPVIHNLQYSSANGETLECALELGGIGISRYTLDELLYQTALNSGAEIIQDSVNEVSFENGKFSLISGEKELYEFDFVLGAYGKRSNLDKSLKREFIQSNSGWLGIKAHYKNSNFPEDLVALHNFEGGYCGLSRTDLGTINVCYLASYESFKRYRNTREFQEKVMTKNPRLDDFFNSSESVFEKELSIAQISFQKKSSVHEHVIMLGDAAGLIHPLCGNGMAMAIHSAKLAAESLIKYSADPSKRQHIENEYEQNWKNHFQYRLKAGRMLQKILLDPKLSKISQRMVQTFPGILPKLIKLTHGKPVHA